MEEANGTPSAASTVSPSGPGYEPSRASIVARAFGVLVLGYGILLAGATSLQWLSLQTPGGHLGPPSVIQAFVLRIGEGIYLGIFGIVLAAGGSFLSRKERRGKNEGRSPASQRWSSLFPYIAVVLIVVAALMSAAPSPQRTLDFAAADFLPLTTPGDGPHEHYLMSRPFTAVEGEAFYPGVSITWTDSGTGALVQRDTGVPAWVTAPSAFPSYAGFTFATGNLAPADGSYVLWVRNWLCETPTTPPCTNYTVSVTGKLIIDTQRAYVSVQLALGAAGSVLMAVALVQSGEGSRRTTSR